ncbi:MAG: hypothetical protein KAH84_05775 [Thiomargarita sp.]|nr:hypothetical protein [Thiomargarita sp.]
MEETLSEIIGTIPKNTIFDSHYIISQLIKFHTDAYLNFAGEIITNLDKTEAVHGKIEQEIAEFEELNTIVRLEYKSWSEDIHGNSIMCKSWQKN